MPVYEFDCNACKSRVQLFFRSMNPDKTCVCDRCGSADLQRVFSRFNVGRPPFDASKFDKREFLQGVDYSNPASMANMMRRVNETFQDEPNDYMQEAIERLDHGENVAKVMGVDQGHDHGSHGGDAGGGDGGE